jgi:C4-dicarboxylate-specific signal transduction histidine kinase
LNWDNQLDKNIKIPLSPVSFFQIIFNLILNASQALNTSNVAKKMIKITVSQIQNKIVIHIMDNGPGLPEIVKQNLFKPYLTTKKSGHGLGLVTAKNFIEKFKGNIFYRGTWENVGTHFELNFPQDLE